MNSYTFNNSAELEIQGAEVLNLLSLEDDYADYEVIGFIEPRVFIRDFRESGKLAIETVLAVGDMGSFANDFNHPSHVTIFSLPAEDAIMIELRETSVSRPQFMLWLAIGIENDIPIYDYVFSPLIRPYDSDRLAIFSVYKRPGFILNKKSEHQSVLFSTFQ